MKTIKLTLNKESDLNAYLKGINDIKITTDNELKQAKTSLTTFNKVIEIIRENKKEIKLFSDNYEIALFIRDGLKAKIKDFMYLQLHDFTLNKLNKYIKENDLSSSQLSNLISTLFNEYRDKTRLIYNH